MEDKKIDIHDIIEKHSQRLQRDLDSFNNIKKSSYSKSYESFKKEISPEPSNYERWCISLGQIIKLKISKKEEEEIQKKLDIAHLDIEPWHTVTLAFTSFLLIFFLGIISCFAVSYLTNTSFPFGLFIMICIVGVFSYSFLKNYPDRVANKWRLKASSQMVPAILYVVIYMRHTSNLEKAISFASEHLEYPLNLDFKKIFYDVEIGKFSTIKESLDNYLSIWRDYSPQFIESFNLIESSLFEPNEEKRVDILEKSLQVVLDGTYDKMLKFTHEVRSPLTNVYMLGVILPTLAIALLPMANILLQNQLKTSHVFVLFNLIVPFLVFYLTDKILFLRPGGHGEISLLEKNPKYYLYKSKKPVIKAFLISFPFLLLGLIPLIFQYTPLPSWFNLQRDYTFSQLGLPFFGEDAYFFGITEVDGIIKGPYGIGAMILSIFFIFGTALFFYISFKGKTSELKKEREKTKELEIEFNNSLFQLGNKLGNGTPLEIAFGKVAEDTKGLRTEDFFKKTNYNITQMGMSVEQALFDNKRGVLIYYPSSLVSTSMKILVESSKKGSTIAALSLVNLSQYVKNFYKITDRLKDLLSEIVSDMKSNMTFLAPILSGIIVGLSMMMSSILSYISNISNNFSDVSSSQFGNIGSILKMFEGTDTIAPYFLQIIVGVYLIEIVFILTKTLVVIDSGEDKLDQIYLTGMNLKKAIFFYSIIAIISSIALSFLSSFVLSGLIQ
jgi:hypothetical protein